MISTRKLNCGAQLAAFLNKTVGVLSINEAFYYDLM